LPPFLSKHPNICLGEVGLILVLTDPLGGGLAHCGLVTKLRPERTGVIGARRILIIGGGIAGLSAAITLGDAGFAAELVEARPEWPVTGAAITMHANGVRALRRLGLDSGLQTAGAELPTWSFHDARGNLLCATISATCGATLDLASA
jgi:hypothetical protein